MKIKVKVPFHDGGYKDVELEVTPETRIKTALGPYLSQFREVIPSYLEPVCYAGKEIPMNAGKTFESCDVKHGDKLHALLRLREIEVTFICVLEKFQPFTKTSLSSTEIIELKRILSTTSGHICSGIPPQRIVISSPASTRLVEDTQKLGEFCPANNSVAFQLSVLYDIFVSVPTYESMTKIVAKVGDTLSKVKTNIRAKFDGSDEVHPLIRGALRNTRGCCMYLYFDLFGSLTDTLIYVDDTAGSPPRTRIRVSIPSYDGKTIGEVYALIKTELNRRAGKIEEDWPQQYTLGSFGVKTFFPQVEEEVHSLGDERESLNLYFFPFKSRALRFEAINAELPIKELMKTKILNQLGIPQTTERVLCDSNSVLRSGDELLGFLHELLTSEGEQRRTLRLRKPPQRRSSMTVYVQLPSSPGKFGVQADVGDNIFTLKDRIEDELGIPIFVQALSFNGDLLDNDRFLHFIGISDGATVQLHARQ